MEKLIKEQKKIIEKCQYNASKLTYAQQTILKQVCNKSMSLTKIKGYDFQDLHWDDEYSVYYDNF